MDIIRDLILLVSPSLCKWRHFLSRDTMTVIYGRIEDTLNIIHTNIYIRLHHDTNNKCLNCCNVLNFLVFIIHFVKLKCDHAGGHPYHRKHTETPDHTQGLGCNHVFLRATLENHRGRGNIWTIRWTLVRRRRVNELPLPRAWRGNTRGQSPHLPLEWRASIRIGR